MPNSAGHFIECKRRENVIVMAASAALFVVGLADDFLHIKPYQKLIGQLLGAAAVVALGLILPWTASYVINVLITLFWLVGITNAVNMLDNMDGLAVGVCAIAAAFLAMNFYAGDQLPHPSQEDRVATGFLRNAMLNEEGGVFSFPSRPSRHRFPA